MKTCAVLSVMLAASLAAGPKAMAGGQDGGPRIPLPVGQFSVTLQGYAASCATSGGVPEPCNASGVVAVPPRGPHAVLMKWSSELASQMATPLESFVEYGLREMS